MSVLSLRIFYYLILIVLFYIIFYFSILLSPVDSVFSVFAKKFLEESKTAKFVGSMLDEAFPAIVSALFGALGALASIHIRRLDAVDALTDSDGSLKQGTLANTTVENWEIQLGCILGFVFYFILQTKFLIKLFYPSLDLPDVEMNFLGTAVVGIVAGFYGRRILTISGARLGHINEALGRRRE